MTNGLEYYFKTIETKLNKKLGHKFLYKKTHDNYQNQLIRLRKEAKHRQLNVIFLVSEKQKWGYQQLYEAMLKDKNFNPIIVASCIKSKYKYSDNQACSVDDNYEFFKSKNINVVKGYVDGKYVDLQTFNPDIVFYQQPWEIAEIHLPIIVSKFALCCYCSYSIASTFIGSKRNKEFFYTLWKYFLAHECMKKEYADWMKYNHESLYVTGHPKLDVFNKNNQLAPVKNKHFVIYAPHFSVGKTSLNFATFDWSGKFMLEYAKSHPEINWVFKPHPQLRRHFIQTHYMTEDELNEYFAEWEKIGMVCNEGNYFDIFKSSDAMITDCGSFCVEYFFTGKPLLHCISSNSKPHSALNQLVNKNHYSIFNQETLKAYLDEIVIKKNDFLKEARDLAVKEIFPDTLNSSENIINYLKSELEI